MEILPISNLDSRGKLYRIEFNFGRKDFRVCISRPLDVGYYIKMKIDFKIVDILYEGIDYFYKDVEKMHRPLGFY